MPHALTEAEMCFAGDTHEVGRHVVDGKSPRNELIQCFIGYWRFVECAQHHARLQKRGSRDSSYRVLKQASKEHLGVGFQLENSDNG